MTELSADPSHSRRPRWWPLIVLIVAEILWLVWVWTMPAAQRQFQVMKTGGSVLVFGFFVVLWLLAFSRLRWRTRLVALFTPVLAIALFAAAFRVSGVTGDLVPVVTPRWKISSGAAQYSPAATAKSGPDESQVLPKDFAGFPQFLGPNRDGIIPGPALELDWKAHPPERLWQVAVGGGFAGFAIHGRHGVTLEQQGDTEAVVCRDLFTGVTLWSDTDPARFENSVGGIGPRTTPAIAGDRAFALGATGHLRALDLTTGRKLWQRDILADARASLPAWGVSGSPLVIDDLVIVHAGGPGHSLAAYRADTGEPAWAGGDAGPGYGSPQAVTLVGEPQILIFNADGISGHARADGRVLWTFPFTKAAQHVTDPRVVAPNRFIVSAGYGAGADLVELSRDAQNQWSTNKLWHTQRLKSKFGSLVVRNGFIYGLDDGRLACIDLATGEPKWKGERVGHGQVFLCGNDLLISAENGEILLQEATPEAAREPTRFQALTGKMWNPPALALPFVIVRTETEAACYRLPVRGTE